jgi:4'-phosphopantetheinyl transferase
MDHVALARRVFSARETAWLVAHSEAQRPKAFFDCWTAKEAYVKARGDGLAFPLQAFHALPGQFEVYDDRSESERWSVLPASLAGDLSAAVAAEGDRWRPTLREWRWGGREGP